MLVKLETWISERISTIVFLPIIFLLALSSDNLLWLYCFILINFFYSWYRKGNLWKAIFLTYIFLPIWYIVFPLLPFQKLFWVFIYLILLLIFLEEDGFGELIILIIVTLFPFIFFLNNILSLELTILLVSLITLLGMLSLFQSLLFALLASMILLEINILLILFPIFSIWRFVLSIPIILWSFYGYFINQET